PPELWLRVGPLLDTQKSPMVPPHCTFSGPEGSRRASFGCCIVPSFRALPFRIRLGCAGALIQPPHTCAAEAEAFRDPPRKSECPDDLRPILVVEPSGPW